MLLHRFAQDASFQILFILTSSLFLSQTRAGFFNVTIDDKFGNPRAGDLVPMYPVYLPQSSWSDESCTGCKIAPDPALANDHTYHGATYHPELNNVSITLDFVGIAIYVYFILPNREDDGVTANTAVNFTLNGIFQSNFSHEPDLSTTVPLFNQLAFGRTGLQNSHHQLVISTNDFPNSTFTNFDYAIYTADDGEPDPDPTTTSSTRPQNSTPAGPPTSGSTQSTTPSRTSSAGIIAGGVIGGLALIAALLLAFLWYRYRRLRHRMQNAPSMSQLTGYHTESNLASRGNPRSHTLAGYTSRPNLINPDPSETSSSVTFGVHKTDAVPFSATQDALRRARQEELNYRMMAVQQEMLGLESGLTSTDSEYLANSPIGQPGNGQNPTQDHTEVLGLREQVRFLQGEIENLRNQQRSAWAQGLSDDPPPGYTAGQEMERGPSIRISSKP